MGSGGDGPGDGPGGWQGAGAGELLAAFDAVRVDYEGMEAERFNDDGTYKEDINLVGEGAGWRNGEGG